jgi:GntR family transcriptional regulator/MocR family aminotransferase
MVCVAPSHQYPTGAVLGLGRRLELLEWAGAAGAWIVEDDYDSEYRYAGRPLATLKHLDTGGRVVYVGTFSKVLFPALRLGYVVLPGDLIEPFLRLRAAVDRHGPTLEQEVTARFLEEGHFVRHLRRMRSLYRERQDELLEALELHLGGFLEVHPSPAGSHLVGWLPAGTDDLELSRASRDAGLVLPPISAFCSRAPERPGLIFGYGAFDRERIRAGARRLAAVVDRLGLSTAKDGSRSRDRAR